MKNIENLANLCEGLKEEKIQSFYNFLEEKGIIKEFSQLIEDGEEKEDLCNIMFDTLNDLSDEYYQIYSFADYVADNWELPTWRGMERVAEAIVLDIMDNC
jgi:hypothetical protein